MLKRIGGNFIKLKIIDLKKSTLFLIKKTIKLKKI